jgi:ribosomal-protein-alanine N-acetyltransferase
MVTFARQWHRGVALPFFGKVESVTSNAFSMRTARLELRAATLEHLEAELEGPERLKNLIGAEVLPSWPPGEYDRFAVAYFRDRLAEAGEAVAVWYVWYAIKTATTGSPATLVACGGYFGPPSPDGTVEVGYSVVPEWRRHGFATELVQALTRRAFDTPYVRRILAETDVDNIASIGVLARCGFRRMGSGREPHYDRFQLDRITSQQAQAISDP